MEKERLEQLVNIKTGKLNANASDENGVYPFFTCSKETLRINKYSYDCECVLVAGNGDLNAKYYNGKFDAYQRTYILTNKDKDKLNLKYLYYFMQNYVETLRNQSIGGVIKYIKLENLTEAKINLVSLERQEEIINTLQKAEEIINERKRQIENLQILVKSQFVEMFGDININNKNWNSSMLKEHIKVIGGYAFKSKEFKKEGIPILRIGNINTGHFIPKDLKFWSKDDKLVQYEILPGDLVISLTGTTGKDDYGNACIMNNAYPLYYLNQRNAKLNLQKSVNKYYLEYALKIPEIKKRLTGISRGVRQANIANKDIENLILPIPPIELQNKFAEIVKQIDKQKFEGFKLEKLLKNLIDEGAKNVKF